MNCYNCVHYKVCEYMDPLSDASICPLFLNQDITSVTLDSNTYMKLLDAIDTAKVRLKRIRRSKNRDSVEMALDRIDSILKGEK